MRYIAFFGLTLSCLYFATSCSKAPKHSALETKPVFSDEKLRRIAELQDKGDVAGLVHFMKAKNGKYRIRAARAYGSIRDTAALPYLFLMMQTDNETDARCAAAWAIGQIGDDKAVGSLLKTASMELEYSVLAEILETLGKCANPEAMNFLRQFKNADTLLQTGHAAGMYRSLFRVGPDSALLQRAIQYIADPSQSKADFYAAHYLYRSKTAFTEPIVSQILDATESTQNNEIQFALAGSLVLSPVTGEQIQRLIKQSITIPQRIETVKLIAKLPGNALNRPELLDAALTDWKAGSDQVNYRTLAYRYGIEAGRYHLFSSDMEYPPANEIPPDELIALSHGLIVVTRGNKVSEHLKSIFPSSETWDQAAIMDALGASHENYKWIRNHLTSDSLHPVVKYHALDALLKTDLSGCYCEYENNDFYTLIEMGLRSGDMAMQSLASLAIQDKKFMNYFVPVDVSLLVQLLDSAIATKVLPRETETWFDMKQARAYLLHEPYNFEHPGFNHPVNWDEVAQIPDTLIFRIETNKGNITIQCHVEDAPGTVWNFLKLVESGFYDGKTFHRIVPNFVIQGGCPRGDGWGAPDWSQRSELSPERKYHAGTVGIASVGPDTEGVQFFITHVATPHLDGRYTVFATVTEGLDIVQLIEPGDVMNRVYKVSNQTAFP